MQFGTQENCESIKKRLILDFAILSKAGIYELDAEVISLSQELPP